MGEVGPAETQGQARRRDPALRVCWDVPAAGDRVLRACREKGAGGPTHLFLVFVFYLYGSMMYENKGFQGGGGTGLLFSKLVYSFLLQNGGGASLSRGMTMWRLGESGEGGYRTGGGGGVHALCA